VEENQLVMSFPIRRPFFADGAIWSVVSGSGEH